MLRRPALLAFVALAASTGGRPAPAQDAGWDPPAIRVAPDHAAFARHPQRAGELIRAGRSLFVAKFNRADGAGRPAATGDSKPTPRASEQGIAFTRLSGPDAMSCHACHIDPRIGGSGDFAANVFVGAHFADVPRQAIGNELASERNTTSIAGAGLIELLAREMTAELQAHKRRAVDEAVRRGSEARAKLTAKGVSFGHLTVRPDSTLDVAELAGVDIDLVVRPFGVKGIAASLREFSIAALNHHHGIQAIERFGWERTGSRDFDEDGVPDEFSIGQVTALVAFQASLPAPRQRYSAEPATRALERRGETLFAQIGCDGCHMPALPIAGTVFVEPGPYNRPGALSPAAGAGLVRIDLARGNGGSRLVRAYTDLKRHDLCDADVAHFCNEVLKQDNVGQRLFLTAKLWDLATSAPYGHRGDLGTVSEAIVAHGGEARAQRDRFLALGERDKRALVAFLLTLGRGAAPAALAPPARRQARASLPRSPRSRSRRSSPPRRAPAC